VDVVEEVIRNAEDFAGLEGLVHVIEV